MVAARRWIGWSLEFESRDGWKPTGIVSRRRAYLEAYVRPRYRIVRLVMPAERA